MKLLKGLGWGILLFVVYKIGSFAFLTSPSDGKNADPILSATDAEADLVIKGLHLTETSGDKLLWEIEADSAQVYQEQQSAQLKNIRLTLYEEQRQILKLRSDNGRLDIQNRDMSVEGQVVAHLPDGLTFETNSLTWENQKRLISTSEPVNISRDNIKIRGMGLVADVGLEKFTLHNGVTTVIN